MKTGKHITAIELENSLNPSSKTQTIAASQFIDCTYEGDLMAKAGVSYTTGREANSVYNETVNGVQIREGHQFPDGIDPYKIPGKPESGLLWGISPKTMAPIGSGDKKIQSYNFRLCLTNDPANKVEITRPEGYDSTHYELLLRYLAAKPAKDWSTFLKPDMMPNHKTDINNNGPFSTDMIGMNYAYPDGDYATRAAITKAHEVYTKGFLYFIGHDPRMPEHLRNQMLKWGYPKDEYTNNGNFSPQMYVREAGEWLVPT
nr:FAD-dependent oxidoreductase [Mucilaginibacter humi]